MGVEPARVGHHPQLGRPDPVGLAADGGSRAAEGGPVRRHAEHRDHARSHAFDQRDQLDGALAQLGRGELVGARRRASYQVGDADPPAGQRGLDLVGHRVGDVDRILDDAGPQQRRVEAVDRVAEVGLGRRGAQARVDPDEQQPGVGADEVGHLRAAEGLQLRPGEADHLLTLTSMGQRILVVGVGGRAYRHQMDGGIALGIVAVLALSLSSALMLRLLLRSPAVINWFADEALPGLRRRLRRSAEQPTGRPIEEIASSIRRLGAAFYGGQPGPLLGEDRGVPPRLRPGARRGLPRPARSPPTCSTSSPAPSTTPSGCASSTCSPPPAWCSAARPESETSKAIAPREPSSRRLGTEAIPARAGASSSLRGQDAPTRRERRGLVVKR